MTAARHRVDSAGVPLPEPSWPDTAGVGGPLDVVRRFCNSADRARGGEAWRDLDELERWLGDEGYAVGPLAPRHFDEAVELRERLWRSLRDGSFEPLAPVVQDVRLVPSVGPDGARLHLRAGNDPVHAIAGRLVEVILGAQADGTWALVKVCGRCGWVFVDHSRNRSGRWCSMSACGGREKARSYRARRREDVTSPSSGERS